MIARAQNDETLPIPVVLNLSSWAAERLRFEDWLSEELNLRYGVPKATTLSWQRNNAILLLLDGLDEVRSQRREDCIRAINAYCRDNLVGIAICSRTAEYNAITTQLTIRGAVALVPLSITQIDSYIALVGDNLRALQLVLKQDSSLQDFVRSPLALSIAALAYRDSTIEEVRILKSDESRRRHLFDAYIAKANEKT